MFAKTEKLANIHCSSKWNRMNILHHKYKVTEMLLCSKMELVVSQEPDSSPKLHSITYPVSALDTHGNAIVELQPSDVP